MTKQELLEKLEDAYDERRVGVEDYDAGYADALLVCLTWTKQLHQAIITGPKCPAGKEK